MNSKDSFQRNIRLYCIYRGIINLGDVESEDCAQKTEGSLPLWFVGKEEKLQNSLLQATLQTLLIEQTLTASLLLRTGSFWKIEKSSNTPICDVNQFIINRIFLNNYIICIYVKRPPVLRNRNVLFLIIGTIDKVES